MEWSIFLLNHYSGVEKQHRFYEQILIELNYNLAIVWKKTIRQRLGGISMVEYTIIINIYINVKEARK